jgi:hypothetical protein
VVLIPFDSWLVLLFPFFLSRTTSASWTWAKTVVKKDKADTHVKADTKQAQTKQDKGRDKNKDETKKVTKQKSGASAKDEDTCKDHGKGKDRDKEKDKVRGMTDETSTYQHGGLCSVVINSFSFVVLFQNRKYR